MSFGLGSITFILFYKQPVYKQLARGCEIAKHFSELNLLSLSNIKNYRLKISVVCIFDLRLILSVKSRILKRL